MAKKKKEVIEEECCCSNDEDCSCGNEESCGCGGHEVHDCCGDHNHFHKNFHHACKPGGGIYGLGLIGSAIFFIGQASTFGEGFIGFLKALVWPAFMAYELFKFLMK